MVCTGVGAGFLLSFAGYPEKKILVARRRELGRQISQDHAITVELPDEVMLRWYAARSRLGTRRSNSLGEAVYLQVAIQRFHETRAPLAPYGEAAGLQCDEAAPDAVSRG